MSSPFVAEIKIFAGNFAPRGWALCDGQLLIISQNTALFSLLGTYYGGDGKVTFALPDLQGRCPIQVGQGAGLSDISQGQMSGVDNVTVLTSEIPSHNHLVRGSNNDGDNPSPANGVWAVPSADRGLTAYATTAGNNPALMAPNATGVAGASLPHNNMAPYLVLNFIIALQGVFPPRQ
jgi:microcystin-dependent protein